MDLSKYLRKRWLMSACVLDYLPVLCLELRCKVKCTGRLMFLLLLCFTKVYTIVRITFYHFLEIPTWATEYGKLALPTQYNLHLDSKLASK